MPPTNRRPNSVRFATDALLIFAVLAAIPLATSAEAKPNIVLIMVDDMGFSDLGCYGSEIETPHLDRLAENGIRFRQFYNTAKCSQTRSTLLSGRYFPEVAFIGPHKNSATIAEVLKTAGYTTLMSGKWHLIGEPTNHGFDRYFGHLTGAVNFFTGLSSRGEMTFRLDDQPWSPPKEGFYTTDAITDFALQFLQEDAAPQSEKPFFLYLAYNAPHYPLHAKRPDVEKYQGRYADGWDKLREQRFKRMKKMGILQRNTELSPRPPEVKPWSKLTAAERREHELTMAAYAGMIDCVDQNIGRVVDYLKATGQFENTLLIFLSDNGGCPFQRTTKETRENWLMPWDPESYWTYDEGWAHASNTPFRWYKQNQHEGGISSPLIAHWPEGIEGEKGRIVQGPGHLIDIAPTLYQIAQASYPSQIAEYAIKPLRGKSLLPILRGEIDSQDREFWQFFRDNKALRLGDWKVVVERRMDEWELFNMDKDRSETNDLAKDLPTQRDSMILRYRSLDQSIKDNAPPPPAAHDYIN